MLLINILQLVSLLNYYINIITGLYCYFVVYLLLHLLFGIALLSMCVCLIFAVCFDNGCGSDGEKERVEK